MWLQNGEFLYDEERLLVAAQDQGLMTKGFKKMARISSDDKCRFCFNYVESPSHLLSGCEILMADGLYTARHNKVCRYLHWKICRDKNIPVEEHVWEHEPQPVTANDDCTIFYDKELHPGSYIPGRAIKPDIVIWNKIDKSALIIDVCVPNDFGLNRAEREKITKYQDLKNDLRRTWQLKEADVIPVVVGATGMVKRNLGKYLKSIPGEPSVYEIQIAAVRGSVSILKRALGYRAD